MAEEIDRGSSDRQATWVAVKTLRQRPTVVGKTDDGATIYEIRSVRLVLTPGSSHFKRLVSCARCGRDVPGSSILAPVDLDRPANPVFCDRCAQSSAPPRPEVRRESEDPPAPARNVVPQGAVGAGQPAAVDPQRAEMVSERIAGLLRGQNAELAKMSTSVAQARADMRELGESNRALARVQGELHQRMVDLEARVAALPVAVPEAVSARDLADLRAGVTDMIDATAQAFHAALRSDLDHRLAGLAAHSHVEIEEKLARELVEVGTVGLLRAEIGLLQQRSQDEFAAVAALLEAQRKELTDALHDVAHETLMSVAEPLRDLTKAREDFERRLGALQRRTEEDQRRMEALNASADAGASKLHALEQKIHASVQRLIHPVEAGSQARAAGPAPAVERRPPGALLESLERQLREAEERLGQL